MEVVYNKKCLKCGKSLLHEDGEYSCISGCEEWDALPNSGVKRNIGMYSMKLIFYGGITKTIEIKDISVSGFFTEEIFEEMHQDVEALKTVVDRMGEK